MVDRYIPDRKVQYAIYNLLRQHLEPVEGKETVRYINGYDDAKITSEVGQQFGLLGKLNRLHVARARREAIGDLEPPAKGPGSADVGRNSWGRLARLEDAFNTLCDRLDAKDLKVTGKPE